MKNKNIFRAVTYCANNRAGQGQLARDTSLDNTPPSFPISSKRDVSRRISINRRRRTIKRKGERGARAKRFAPGAFTAAIVCIIHALHL